MSENLTPVTAETSTDEDDIASSKSKTKKKALGAFVVETEPPKKPESWWASERKTEFDEPLIKTRKPEKAAKIAEELESEEKIAAIQQLAAARRAEVTDESEAADSPATETEIAAAAAYLAAAEALGDSEAAYQQIAAELAIPPETAVTGDEIDTEQPHEGEIDLRFSPAVAETATVDEPSDEAEAPARTTSPDTVGRSTADSVTPPSGPGGSGEGRPPLPPSPGRPNGPPPNGNLPAVPGGPSGPSGPGGPYTPGGPGGPQGPDHGFNAAPPLAVAPGETAVPLSAALANERRALTDGLIVGGIVGYLYGRRRGRIKTEKRLAPVQRKLEKQVKALQTELLQAETVVRQQARKLQRESPLVAAAVTERLQRSVVRQQAIKRPERQAARPTQRPETQNRQPVLPPERIGQVLIAASAAGGVERMKAEIKAEIKVPVTEATQKKRAETMTRTELLAVSETVQVDGTTLRQIYETQLVSEKGLRRLVTEHLRGGNVSRALRRELVQHQIDFERDPILRDRGSSNDGSSVGGAGRTALSGLLAQAGISDQAQAEPLVTGPKKRDNISNPATTKPHKPTSVVDGALLTLIVLLIIVIVAVLMRSR